MSLAQWIVAGCRIVAGGNAIRQALVAFAIGVPLATILGTEPLLADAMPFAERLPGYLVTASLGLGAAWGGIRELARARAVQAHTRAAELPSGPPDIAMTTNRARQPTGSRATEGSR